MPANKRRFTKAIAPAVALALAFGAVSIPDTPATPVAAAQTSTATPVIDTTGFTVSQWEALTAQATLELINKYRVANGLHPLRTHVLYNEQALEWSKVMAADGDTCDYSDGDCWDWALRHSDSDIWGWSGENILLELDSRYRAESLTKEQWARLAVIMFEDWRNSPNHNVNMLDTTFQGIGLGLKVSDEKNVAFGTTQFFIESTALTKSYFKPIDAVTKQALNSNEPFYMAGGAMKALGITTADAPFTDTKGITPSYTGLTLNSVSGPIVVDILGGRNGQAAKNSGLSTKADPTIWTAPAMPTPTSTTSKSPTPTSAKPTPTTTTPKPTPTSSTSKSPTTSTKPTPTSTSPKPTTSKPMTSKPNTPTSTKQTQPNPQPDPSREGSSVGAIIGIIVGVLALVGLGAAAMGMMNGGFQLPF